MTTVSKNLPILAYSTEWLILWKKLENNNGQKKIQFLLNFSTSPNIIFKFDDNLLKDNSPL